MSSSYSSVDWILSTGPISLYVDSCVCILCFFLSTA